MADGQYGFLPITVIIGRTEGEKKCGTRPAEQSGRCSLARAGGSRVRDVWQTMVVWHRRHLREFQPQIYAEPMCRTLGLLFLGCQDARRRLGVDLRYPFPWLAPAGSGGEPTLEEKMRYLVIRGVSL